MFKRTYTHLNLEFVLKILKFHFVYSSYQIYQIHIRGLIFFYLLSFKFAGLKDCHIEYDYHYYYRCPSSDSGCRGSHRSQTVRNIQPKIVSYKID